MSNKGEYEMISDSEDCELISISPDPPENITPNEQLESNKTQIITSSITKITSPKAKATETTTNNVIQSNQVSQTSRTYERNVSNHCQHQSHSISQIHSLVLSNLPSDVTENELKSLSDDIKNVNIIVNKRKTDF